MEAEATPLYEGYHNRCSVRRQRETKAHGVALFQHYCSIVAERYFTILALVHRPALNYKRGGWHSKQARRKTQREKEIEQ
jgi:hypothetical protein